MYWRVRMYECPRGQIIAKLTSTTVDNVKPHFIIRVKRCYRFICTAKKVVVAGCGLKGLQIRLTIGKEFGLGLAIIIIPIMIQHRVQPSDSASHSAWCRAAAFSQQYTIHDCSQLRTLVTT